MAAGCLFKVWLKQMYIHEKFYQYSTQNTWIINNTTFTFYTKLQIEVIVLKEQNIHCAK